MIKTFIIPTSTAEHLAKSILTKPGSFEVIFSDLNKDRKRCFPGGEVYLKILKVDKLKGKRVVILHSGAPKPNKGLVELELILEILKDYKIKPEIFFTYFPYGIQDKIFEKGEINVAKNLIEKLINYYKVKKIYIIDPHFGGRKWIKKYPIKTISALPTLTQKIKKDFGEDILFLSPDLGGQRRTGIRGIKKKRLNSYTVEIESSKGLKRLVNERIVGVVDDMIKTGGTLLKFGEIAKKSGARKIIALVTHGVMASGVSKVKEKYSNLYLTKTVKQKGANIDITDLILKTISKS